MSEPKRKRLPDDDSVSGQTLLVETVEEIEQIINKHEYLTASKYICKKKEKDFGKEAKEIDLQTRVVRIRDTQENASPPIPSDGIPFIIVARKILECHQGTDRDQTSKEKRKREKELLSEEDHSYKKRKKMHQDTKKKSCPASIKIRHIIKFPDFMVKEDCKTREKMAISTEIKEQLRQLKIKMQHQFLIFLPDECDHRNHLKGEVMLLDMVETWKKENTEDSFFLRIKQDTEENRSDLLNMTDLSDCPDEDIIVGDNFIKADYERPKKFLYVHQTNWQKRLLELYGGEICLLDATYRTTKYSLPLYFLCVPTNVNYITVASFVLETEDSVSIQEALEVIQKWNPNWKPKYFMCDYAAEEINSLETVFPDSFVYLCDFHREQAWERWLSAGHNGMSAVKNDVLPFLRDVASALTEQDYDSALERLKHSQFWVENEKFRDWIEKRWLKINKRWVKAFRQERFNVSINTNNGIEHQNLCLKYEYLQMRKAKSLCNLLSGIIDRFLPDTYKKYLTLNVSASSLGRSYSSEVPVFLQNRPKNIVKHLSQRWQEAENISKEDIGHVEHQLFSVKSATNADRVYTVNFNANYIQHPSCDCSDWIKHHLICKHFMAIIKYGFCEWDHLPSSYRNSPWLNLDIQQFENHNSSLTNQTLLDGDSDKDEDIRLVSNLPVPTTSSLKKARSTTYDICNQIMNYSHTCKDINVLHKLNTALKSSLECLTKSLPQTDDFILDDNEITYIGSSKPTEKKTKSHSETSILAKPVDIKKKTTIQNLPLTKPKKKGVGRVGIKADKQKITFTSKGVGDLSKEREVMNCFTNNIREHISSMDSTEWQKLVKLAYRTSNLTADLPMKRGYAAFKQFCGKLEDNDDDDDDDDDDDLILEAIIDISRTNPQIATLTWAAKYRIIHLIIDDMVNLNKICLIDDPKVDEDESAHLFLSMFAHIGS